jgi:PAS domain S-box-containing protein
MPATTPRKVTLALMGAVAVVLATGVLTLVSMRRVDRLAVDLVAVAVLTAIVFAGGAAVVVRRSIGGDLSRIGTAEAALRRAEHRFHAVFDQAFQFTLLLTPSGEVAEANDAALAFHGGLRARVVGRPLWDLPAWSEDGRMRLRAAVAQAADGGFVRLEQSSTDSEGCAVTFDVSLKAMRDAAGGVEMLIYEARDISLRTAAEVALRTSEVKFSGIMSIAADAIITVDEEQRIVHFNRGAEEIFGWSADEMIGQPLEMLLPVGARTTHHGQVTHFAHGPESARRMGARREVAGRRRDGEEFPAEASISRLESDGHLLLTVMLRDITERRRAEERQRFLSEAGAVLARSLDYHQTLAEVAHLAMPMLGDACIVDVDGADGLREIVVAHLDPTKEETMRELRRSHPPGANPEHPLAVVRQTLAPMLIAQLDEAFLTRTSAGGEHTRRLRELAARSAMYVPLVARDHFLGVLSYYTAGPRPFTDDDLGLAAALAERAAIAIDNARLYEAARHASAARDEVLAVVSHDLRNPLSTIGMCAGALLDPEPITPDGVRSMAETMHVAADWAQRIIRDLLDVTTIEAGRLSLVRGRLHVEPLLESVREVMHLQALDAGVALRVAAEGTIPPIDADAERVVQVLLNLVGNAIKFTPRGGRVVIGAAVDPASEGHRPLVRFQVRDTGTGIAGDDLAHVFDRYWQLHRTGRGGAGLGLAIARGLVEAHGGTIAVTSTPGAGSSFSFTIPAFDVVPQSLPEPGAARETRAG